MANKKRNTPGAIESEERRAEAVSHRRKGLTYREIGDKMGYSESRAHAVVIGELNRIRTENKEEIEEVKSIELARLDKLTLALSTDAELGDLDAINTTLKLMDRRSKLLGLDAPKKLDLKTTNPLHKLSDDDLNARIKEAENDK